MIAIITLVLCIPLALWRGFALSVLWGWHVSPMFGVAEISAAQGWGFCVVVALLTYQFSYANHENSDGLEKQITDLLIGLLLPAVGLLSGWLALLFI